VRGDSLRDLYAKTLAVLGLGLLAGAGAIVDYWPVGAPIPMVSAPVLPTADRPVLVQHLDQQIPSPRFVRPAPPRPAITPKNVGSAVFLRAEFGQPAAPAVIEPVPAPPAFDLPEAELPLEALMATPVYELAWFAPAPAPAAAPATGFFGGALRKTKDSIVRTGAVTGATIADAFKGVLGAFRKVTPFWESPISQARGSRPSA